MGLQSSRIIWGKNKSPGGNEPDPVGLYNGDNYIYCSGNYAIHSDGSVTVAEDYHLYLCTAAETGGAWVPEDWKLINGVNNYYPQGYYKVFKKGARVIKGDYNGDWKNLKLYVCVVNQTTPKSWVESEWDIVYQDVGIAWMPRDHKDVYYDSGSNRNKWHKMMYFIPDYYDGQKTDEEIAVFNENQTYHFGERAIHTTLLGETYCYTYDSNIPRRAEWSAGWWSKDENVGMYETYKTYYKGDEVIKKNVEAGYQDIQEYQDEMYFEQGKYTLSIIDREHDVTALAGFHDILYIERIYAGESLYGVYKSNKTTSGSFNWQDWDLQTSEVIQTRGRDHNMVPIHTEEDTGITCRYCGKFITGYKQKDIKEYNYESGYEEGELVIWTFNDEDSVFGLLECQKPIPQVTGPGEYNPATAPPNSEYWTPISQFVEQANTLRVFKATKAMDASINTHFIRENWAIVSQKMEPDYDLYGVIWEKYGVIGSGGAPFGYAFPTYGSTAYSDNLVYRRGRLSYFLTTATNAKFNAYETYNIHLNSIYTDGGTGFTMLVIFNGIAYGFPVFDATYFNFIYVKLFDDWKKVEILDYYNGNDILLSQSYNMSNYTKKITLISGGFIALKDVTPYIYDGNTYRHKLFKVTISPEGSFLGSEEITVPDILKYNVYTSDLLIHFFKNELVYLSNITYPINSYYINYGDSYKQIYFYKSYILTSSGFANINSDTIDYFDYIYEYYSQNNYSVFELEDIKQHAYILLANVNKENVSPEPSVAEFTAAANAMGLSVRTEHVSGDYYRYWIDNCPTKVYCNIVSRHNIYEDGISYNSHYKIIWNAYYYTTDSDMDTATYHLRVISNIRVINSLIGATDYILFDEDLDTLITLRALRQSDQHFDTDGVPTDIHPIGRLGYKYYFISYLPDFSNAGFDSYDHRILYDNKTKANRLYSIDLVSHEIENICPAYDYITLRYINNGYVMVNGHKIKELRLWLYESTVRRHYLTYETADQEGYQIANAYIPFNDQNIFSNSTGSAVSVYNNNLFLSDWIEDTYSYGLFIYLPIVTMNSQITMEATGFFWMSSGNNDRGDFYGGYIYDETSFDLPLVF